MHSIRTRITALTLAAILISIASFGAIGIFFITEESGQISAQNLNLICENRKDSLNEYLNSIQQSVGMISRYAVDSLDQVKLTKGGVLGASGTGAQEIPGRTEQQRREMDQYFDQHLAAIETAFQSIANHTNGIASCYYRINPEITTTEKGFFFSKKGNYDFQKIELTHIHSYDPEDIDHVGWYYIPLRQGRPSWITPYHSEKLDELVISYVVPLYKAGTFIGVIGMDIQYDTLVKLIQQFTNFKTGYFVLTDAKGMILFHPEYKMGTQTEDIVPQLYSIVKAMHQDSSQQQLIRYEKNGSKWQMAYTTLSNGMKLVAAVKDAEINATAYNLTKVFVLAGMLILLIFIVFSTVSMRHVTDPLEKLTTAAKRLAEGDYDAELDGRGNDEVGVLTSTFCAMRDRLQEQFTELVESKKSCRRRSPPLSWRTGPRQRF